jgi:hypothetical protein
MAIPHAYPGMAVYFRPLGEALIIIPLTVGDT